MTTEKTTGDSLKLRMQATGAVTFEGIKGSFLNDQEVKYEITDPGNIVINGDVTYIRCEENQLKSLDVTKG